MGLSELAIALCAAVLGPARGQDEGAPGTWDAIWARLAEARALAPDAAGREEALEALLVVAKEQKGTLRSDLLRAHVERALGHEASLRPAPGAFEPWPLHGVENWLAAEVLEPSPARAQAAGRAVLETEGQIPAERVRLAWEIAVEEARALRLENARTVQEALHQRFLAVWSAMDFALTEARLGAYDAADEILAAQIGREAEAGRSSADLWAQRGTLAVASGDEERGRDYLGFARARGSTDAGVVLARLDFERGRLPEARAGFRALLIDKDPSPWAPRGWGLALLPRGSGGTSQVGD